MIHYHGGPITPEAAALACWQGRHAMISFAHPDQVVLAMEVCQSVTFDNGAFSMWRGGKIPFWPKYYEFVRQWMDHPGFDWAIIPDVIDGTEDENDALIKEWPFPYIGVPVWHFHESLERLARLADEFPRIALGSSGEWATVGTDSWWHRMGRAMEVIQDGHKPKLHGLRMLNPEVFRHLPLASADSTNVARNVGLDQRWKGTYQPATKAMRASILAHRIEQFNSSAEWIGGPRQETMLENSLFSWPDQRM